MNTGAVPDGGTIEWWLKQSSEARAAILTDQVKMKDALLRFREFVNEHSDEKFVQVWGNGATFDNAILRTSYERLDIPVRGITATIVMYAQSLRWGKSQTSMPEA